MKFSLTTFTEAALKNFDERFPDMRITCKEVYGEPFAIAPDELKSFLTAQLRLLAEGMGKEIVPPEFMPEDLQTDEPLFRGVRQGGWYEFRTELLTRYNEFMK